METMISRYILVGGLLLLALLLVSSSLAQKSRSVCTEIVLTDWGGVGNEIEMEVSKGRLQIKKPRVVHLPGAYTIAGRRFLIDPKTVETNYNSHRVEGKLQIKNGTLYYDGASVALPRDVRIRNVWQAILWKGWVICLGRTSRTDKEAQMTPPFFATELITFSIADKAAEVRYLSFQPPPDVRLYILCSS